MSGRDASVPAAHPIFAPLTEQAQHTLTFDSMKKLAHYILALALMAFSWPVFAQDYNFQLRSTMTFPGQTLANICGYTQDGREYALLGGSKGLIVVDITNPDAPQQIVQIPGPDNLWKEIKVYGHYAYVTSEGGQGVQIVDMSPLPSPDLPHKNYKGDGPINGQLDAIHALHIDVKKGFLYAYGSNLFSGGAVVLNLADPYNPTYAGKFDQLGYIHDGYADNDTLYAAHIYTGQLSIVDMSNKSAPALLGTVLTPAKFTHNAWLLDDHKHILTTDEKVASFVASYDISNPEDIRELDRVATTVSGTPTIGHNTHVLNDWAITSWYTDGVTIVDAHRPDILVEVARYDTWAPATNPNNPFEGCWGAFPYFPSGTIVTSDIEPGKLTVLTPTYERACYLVGSVINGCDGNPMNGATITVNTPDDRVNTTTGATGTFKTGYVTPGDYVVTISKPGFVTQTIPFTFTRAVATEINVTLAPESTASVTGTVTDALTGDPIPNATVNLTSPSQNFSASTDASGQFELSCIEAASYTATAGAWGYLPKSAQPNSSGSYSIALERGYYDDFQLDLGWTTSAVSPTGLWELGEPVGTQYQGNPSNPDVDVNSDNNDQCYVTGNGGGDAGSDDVDNGSVTLATPPMKLAGGKAKLSFYYWFLNGGGQGTTPNDKFTVNVTSNGQTATIFTETVSASQWRFSGEIELSNYVPLSDDVRIQFIASDDQPGHLVEAAVDVFKVVPIAVSAVAEPDANAVLLAAPNPSSSVFSLQYAWETVTEAPILEVRNTLGQIIVNQQLESRTGVVQVGADWAPGVYFAVLKSSNGGQSRASKLVRN